MIKIKIAIDIFQWNKLISEISLMLVEAYKFLDIITFYLQMIFLIFVGFNKNR